MDITYRELLNTTDMNNIYILKKPFLTENIEPNYTIHKDIRVYDENLKDFKNSKVATLDGFNFICMSPKEFSHEGVHYKKGDDVFVNCNNNKYKIIDLNKFDQVNDFEIIDFSSFKDEVKDIENSKKLSVEFFIAKIDSDYTKKFNRLKDESSIKIGAIKINNQ